MSERNQQPMAYVVIVLILVLALGVGYFMWRESRTDTASISLGDQAIEVETTTD